MLQGEDFMKDERELLTRQLILKKLTWESKRSIVNSLLIFLLSGLFFGIFILLLAVGLPPDAGIVKFIPLILFIPVVMTCAFSLVRALLRMHKANRGDFTVAEDVLAEIRDNEFSLTQLIRYGGIHTFMGDKSHLRHVFQFESGKTFIANVQEYRNTRLGVAAEFSYPGDRFFLVFYNDSPNKIILLFSSKTYNYRNDK